MIYVFKLISGEEYIGALDSDEDYLKNDAQFFNITSPMAVVDGYDEYGAVTMKLRDGLLLSDESLMTIPSKFVVTYYPASKVMISYYEKAIEYSHNYSKKKIERQIKDATATLEDAMSETSMEKLLKELRLRNVNPGSGTIN